MGNTLCVSKKAAGDGADSELVKKTKHKKEKKTKSNDLIEKTKNSTESKVPTFETGPKAPSDFKPKLADQIEPSEISSAKYPTKDFNQFLLHKTPDDHISSNDEGTIKISKWCQLNFNDFIWQLIYSRDLKPEKEVVRAIFIWLVSKNVSELHFSNASSRSPEETLNKLKNREATYAEVFALLCHYANIKCKVINGYAKGVEFVPGMKLSNNTHAMHSWNAALIDGNWHLFDCHWAGRRLVSSQPAPDQVLTNVDDFYYMPDPNHLKYTHHPQEENWQLTTTPLNLESFERYCPVKSSYFKNHLELISHKDGYVEYDVADPLIVKVKHSADHPVFFTFSLRNEVLGEIYKTEDMANYGLHYQDINLSSQHNFELRFPRNGIYSLLLYVRECNCETFSIFAEYRIEVMVPKADQPKNVVMPFPTTQQNQYGPTEVADEIGLKILAGNASITKIHENDKPLDIVLASCDVEKPLPPFVCQMRGMGMDEEHLSHFVLQRYVTLDGQTTPHLVVTPFFPRKGEYALELYAGSDSENYRLVYQWLLQNENVWDLGPLPVLPGNILGILPEFNSVGLSLLDPLDPLIYVNSSFSKESFVDSQLKIKLPPLTSAGFPSIRVIGQLTTINSKCEELSLTEYLLQQVNDSELTMLLRFPYKGLFKLHLYGHALPDLNDTLPLLATFLFIVKNDNLFGSTLGPYPKQTNKWKEGAHLIEPTNGILKTSQLKDGRKLFFSLTVPRAKDVVVVLNEDDVSHLEATTPSDKNSKWTGEITLPEGVADKICVAGRWTSAIANYPTLLEYRLENDV